jgi:ferrochelatase
MAALDAVMLIAFGGPENIDEVRPFLRRVLEGRPVSEERFEAVVHHYEVIGGRSPLGAITRQQAAALEAELARSGAALPVVIGMRNSAPFLRDTLAELHARGARRVLGLVMAAHESPASHGRYEEAVTRANAELGERALDVKYTRGFHAHPGFIAANVEHARTALAHLTSEERTRVRLVFTAHSIPLAVAERSPYVTQLTESARLVAEALGMREFGIAYQSRSGSPRDPWLEPDINDVIREAAKGGTGALLLCPIGFVCDHVEVLYDLDIEALATARAASIALVRAESANAHPAFIAALADRVREASSA